MFDQIDRSSEDEPAVHHYRFADAARIASLVVQAEAELEILRLPCTGVGQLLHPDAEISLQLADLVAPDTRDRRGERLRVLRRHPLEHRVERRHRPRHVTRLDRQRPAGLHRPVELRLHLVKQTSARQRVHADQRLGLVPRFESIDRRQQELIRARGEALQRRQRIRTLAQTMSLERGAGSRRDLDESIARRPRRTASRPAADHRSTQGLVQSEHVVRPAARGGGIARIEQRLQHGQVVLEVVDRAIGISGRRPRQAGAALAGGVGREHAMIRDAAGDRAHDIEGVERRHARARLADVQSRVRKIEALTRGPDRDLQQQTLGLAAALLIDQRRIELFAPLVEQQRILPRPLRHDAFGQAWDKHHTECAATRLMRGPDEQPAVTAGRRFPVERHQAVVQDVARFFERHRADIGHRPQIGEQPLHALRTPQRTRRSAR